MQHRRVTLLGAVGLTMTLIAGCGSVGGGGGGSSTPAAGASQDPKDMTMVNVVKIKGISWFDRMAVGDENFAKRTGVDTRQEGADDTSPEKQIQIIQDLIPQKPTAITVVPNSPEALQNVLGQARGQGSRSSPTRPPAFRTPTSTSKPSTTLLTAGRSCRTSRSAWASRASTSSSSGVLLPRPTCSGSAPPMTCRSASFPA